MTKLDNWRNADGRTADPFSGLRAAIAAGPEDGLWAQGSNSESLMFGVKRDNEIEPIGFVYGPSCPERSDYGRRCIATSAYIAAANPAAIRTLLDEHDRLAEEAAAMRELLREAHGVIKTVQAESTEEADLLAELLRWMEGAIVPNNQAERPTRAATKGDHDH